MPEQTVRASKGEQERSVNSFEGLTSDERVRLEESMRRNEKLMKRLAEM
jgi:hypothetical protein